MARRSEPGGRQLRMPRLTTTRFSFCAFVPCSTTHIPGAFESFPTPGVKVVMALGCFATRPAPAFSNHGISSGEQSRLVAIAVCYHRLTRAGDAAEGISSEALSGAESLEVLSER